MKRAAIRYAEILEKGAWVTHQEQAEIAKLLRSLVMNDDAEDRAWDELEARLNSQKKWDTNDMAHRPNGLSVEQSIAQPEQEPVAYLCENAVGHKYFRWKKPTSHYKPIALYTSPPSKPWVGLSNADLQYQTPHDVIVMRYAEALLKEKNT